MDTAERDLFAAGLRHATERHTGEALDAALDELGWADARADDPRTAVSLLFGLQGEAGATSSGLDEVLLAALGLDGGAGVVLPRSAAAPPGEISGEGLRGRGLGTAARARRPTAVVVAGAQAVVVDTASLDRRPVRGLDPRLGLVEVTFDGVAAASGPAPVAWDEAVAAGRRALAHELVGVSRSMLRLARDHAVERIQFGRPIAMFQAVRHRLAEALVAIEGADAVAGAAWDDGTPLTAALAKAGAGRAARTTAKHCQQVLAGIGFTTEHPFHTYVRRAFVLDHLLGDARALTQELGAGLLDDRRLPAILPL